jgi:hypothetical protein
VLAAGPLAFQLSLSAQTFDRAASEQTQQHDDNSNQSQDLSHIVTHLPHLPERIKNG